MANFLFKPTMTINQPFPNFFEISVSYIMTYTQQELSFEFADSLFLLESDAGEVFGGADDFLVNISPEVFRPRSTRETRTITFSATSEQLGTESGGEELYAQVHHVRKTPGAVVQTRATDIFPLAV